MLVSITRNGMVNEYHIPDHLDFVMWLKGYTLDGAAPIDNIEFLSWED